MIRDALGTPDYWEERVEKDVAWLKKCSELTSSSTRNPEYDPQFTFDISKDVARFFFTKYSRGDDILPLKEFFPLLISMWERSERLSVETCAKHNLKSCRAWEFDLANLNHYIWCFWVVGFALLLDVSESEWQRTLALVGGEGQDILLDRIVASRQSERAIGTVLLHKKPYARLLKAIDASVPQQAVLLREFVEHWYPELDRNGKQRPWWYLYADPERHPLEMGSYFGLWCIEAAVAVKAFGLDDSQCLGHESYPGDLLRPNGSNTHSPRPESKPKWSLLGRLFGK